MKNRRTIRDRGMVGYRVDENTWINRYLFDGAMYVHYYQEGVKGPQHVKASKVKVNFG